MTNDPTPPPGGRDQPPAEVDARSVSLLGDAAVWADPDPGIEDAVVAAITAEAGRQQQGGRGRQVAVGALLGVAASVVVLLIAVGIDVVRVDRSRGDAPAATVVALASAEEGPEGASAEAAFLDRPDGTRIELQVAGLPPAAAGEWYEMQLLRPDDPPVSAGSFHLRGGGGRVVLWAGIGLGSDVAVEITRQPQGTTVLASRR